MCVQIILLIFLILFQKIEEIENNIITHLADNFNTSRALHSLIELISLYNKLLTPVLSHFLVLFYCKS